MSYTDTVLLIADSDAQRREAVRSYFARHGFSVETAADGLECVEQIRLCKPDFLIIDLELPWGGGDGVLSYLDEGTEFWKTPQVLVLGSEAADVAAARVGIRPESYYQEPFRLESLMDSACQAMVATQARHAMESD